MPRIWRVKNALHINDTQFLAQLCDDAGVGCVHYFSHLNAEELEAVIVYLAEVIINRPIALKKVEAELKRACIFGSNRSARKLMNDLAKIRFEREEL